MAAGGDLASRSAPFVLTLEMDGESFAALDALRRRTMRRSATSSRRM